MARGSGRLVKAEVEGSRLYETTILWDRDRVVEAHCRGVLLYVLHPSLHVGLNWQLSVFSSSLLQRGGFSKTAQELRPALTYGSSAAGGRFMSPAGLRKMAETLRQAKLPKTRIPKTFKGKLRSYQQTGVDFLQRQRALELGAVLADDMGLGKTVQVLAHLCAEKTRGRLKQGALLIAPTSVVGNWVQEAARFAPSLRVCAFHGKERHELGETIFEADLLVTSFALVVRDMDHLAPHPFDLVIVDEAQAIKNPRSKTAISLQRLDAKQRICLTGTPLENSVLDVWSLFHFLMPGLLGAPDTFRKRVLRPIEKQGNQEAMDRLMGRIKPFVLRRRKEEVALELPPKTQSLRRVPLQGAQRNLYEAVRVTMLKRVRDALAKKGLAQSHITILDALLKLRQVCCDPRLLPASVQPKKRRPGSAKLQELLDLLEALHAEGAKVLLFSQFTSMIALIEDAIASQGWRHAKLTGATPAKTRQSRIEAFQSGKSDLFLISLKAGGTGLNLTEANTVILYDSWWNPAVEAQATDRAHRIGQQRPAHEIKLIAEGTVEERICELQTRKANLAAALFDQGSQGRGKLSEADVEALFAPL